MSARVIDADSCPELALELLGSWNFFGQTPDESTVTLLALGSHGMLMQYSTIILPLERWHVVGDHRAGHLLMVWMRKNCTCNHVKMGHVSWPAEFLPSLWWCLDNTGLG